jgi:hypothetical protein
MTHVTWPDGADVFARVGRHWGWMMAFGVISLLGIYWVINMEITLAFRAWSAGRRVGDRQLDPV